MQWTFEHHKHYSAEHLQKANKQPVLAKSNKQSALPKELLGERRDTRQIL